MTINIENMPLLEAQKEFLKRLCAQTGIAEDKVISRIQLNTGKDNIINVVPNPVDDEVFFDGYSTTYSPNWYDIRVMVVTDNLLDLEDYIVEDYEYFNIKRAFLGTKIVVDMGVRF